jgi:hypothetical protein
MRIFKATRAAMVAGLLIAVHPAAAQTCSVTLTDITDYSAPQGTLAHFYIFQAVGTGNIDQVYLYAPSVQGRFNLYCGTKDFCQMVAFCVTPGSYKMNAYAYCADGTEATPQQLPLVVSDERPDHWITGVTPLGGTQYKIETMFRLPVGQNPVGPEWDVFKRLPDGTFSTEYGRFFIPTVTATPGDRVDVFFGTCGDLPGIPYSKVVTTYIPLPPAPLSIEVVVLDGNGQGAVVGEPAEKPLRVKFTASDPSFNLASLTALFEVITVPAGATGQGLGANETSVAQTYSVPVAADGTASARFVAGNTAGAYVVRVKSPMSLTGSQALFTTTAQKPDSVAILKDSADIADKASTYAVAADSPTAFFAVGLDKAGQKIGPLKCAWSLKASGNGATRGDGTVSPAAGVASTSFTPNRVGQIALSAKSAIKGVSAANADLYITSLYVDLDNSFSANSPVDQKDRFIPGVTASGSDLPLATMTGSGQIVKLHLLTGPGAKGQVSFSVDTSHFPGVAMNYPIQNPGLGADMTFGTGTTTTLPFAGNGDTVATLSVHDYGAIGTFSIKVTAGKNTYTLKPLRLPVDNGFGLPSAGWPTAAGHIETPGLRDSDDIDDQPAGQAGDGLSNFEEYRGFVAATTHVRTDPHKRDIFVAADPQFLVGTVTTPTLTTTLPFPARYLDLSEVAGDDYPGRAITKGSAVIDPNRAGIPGARSAGQRAVRLVMQVQYPPAVVVEIAPGVLQNAPAWQVGIFGATILDSTNPDVIDQAAVGGAARFAAESPDTTRWSEVYERTFTNSGIATNFMNVLFNDENGQPVPPCPSAGTITGCDEYDFAHHLVLPRIFPGGLFELHSVPYPGDWYSKRTVTCADQVNLVDYGVTDAEMQAAKPITGAHELGHSLHIDHTLVCGNLMFAFNIPPFPSIGMIDIQPLPIFFSPDEASQIQLRP